MTWSGLTPVRRALFVDWTVNFRLRGNDTEGVVCIPDGAGFVEGEVDSGAVDCAPTACGDDKCEIVFVNASKYVWRNGKRILNAF